MKFSLPEQFSLSKIAAKIPGKLPGTLKMPGGIKLPKAMRLDLHMGESSRYFSGKVFEGAILSIDKITLWVVGIVWLVAVVAMGMAFMAVRGMSDLKLKVEVARALEPTVPKITRASLSREQYAPLLDRVKKLYPGLSYEITGRPSLRIFSNNGEDFGSWLNAIGYTDALLPAVRWSLLFFCAGSECPGQGLMQAELVAETINISQPEGGPSLPAPASAATAAPATH